MNRFQIKNIEERYQSLVDRYERTYVKATDLNDYINRMFMINTTFFNNAYRQTDNILLNIGLNVSNEYDIYLDINYRITDKETIFINYIELEYYKDGKNLAEELKNIIEEKFADDNERWDYFEQPEVYVDMTKEEFIVFEYGGICNNYRGYEAEKSIYDDTYRVTIIG